MPTERPDAATPSDDDAMTQSLYHQDLPGLARPAVPSASDLNHREGHSAAFVARWKGQTFRLTARDVMHARIIAYMAVWPESKWNEVSAAALNSWAEVIERNLEATT